ncbi:hypothetical protein BFW89_17730 [Pseudomonas synxantha]|nr:hypothetical protein BFW89_17730 [Pseudomonas synxantha]
MARLLIGQAETQGFIVSPLIKSQLPLQDLHRAARYVKAQHIQSTQWPLANFQAWQVIDTRRLSTAGNLLVSELEHTLAVACIHISFLIRVSSVAHN